MDVVEVWPLGVLHQLNLGAKRVLDKGEPKETRRLADGLEDLRARSLQSLHRGVDIRDRDAVVVDDAASQRDRPEDTFVDRRATHCTGHRQNVVLDFWREAKQP